MGNNNTAYKTMLAGGNKQDRIAPTASYPTEDIIIAQLKEQGTISKYLKQGRGNAISKEQLVETTGLSERQVRLLIEKDRNNHIPILALRSGGGYYLPEDNQEGKIETEVFFSQLASQGLSLVNTARNATKEIEKIKGQSRIEM